MDIDPLEEVAFDKAINMLPSERRGYLEGEDIDTSGMSEDEILECVADKIYEGLNRGRVCRWK